MEKIERIKAWIRIENGKTVCHCPVKNPHCNDYENCEVDLLDRNKFRGWKECFKQDRYGK